MLTAIYIGVAAALFHWIACLAPPGGKRFLMCITCIIVGFAAIWSVPAEYAEAGFVLGSGLMIGGGTAFALEKSTPPEWRKPGGPR